MLPLQNEERSVKERVEVGRTLKIQRASLHGRLPPATLAHKETIEQDNANEADRGPSLGVN